jgi:hypothetical protein
MTIYLLLTVWNVDLTAVRLEDISPTRPLWWLLSLRNVPHILVPLIAHRRIDWHLILVLPHRELLRKRLHLVAVWAVFVGRDGTRERHGRGAGPSVILGGLCLNVQVVRYGRMGAIWHWRTDRRIVYRRYQGWG